MSEIYVKRNFVAGLETSVTGTLSTDVINKGQIESMIAGADSAYDAVRLHSHTNVDIATGGLLTIDGATLLDGDRVLLSGQTDPVENGIYIAAAGAWSRAADMADASTALAYSTVYVTSGTEGGGHQMALQSTTDVTVGTDAQTWIHTYTFDNDAAHIDVDNTNFGAISGTNVQDAIDSIDNAIETLQLEYDGNKASATGVTFVGTQWTNVTHNLNELRPSSIMIYDANGTVFTHAFDVDVVDANTIRVYNGASDKTNMEVYVRV